MIEVPCVNCPSSEAREATRKHLRERATAAQATKADEQAAPVERMTEADYNVLYAQYQDDIESIARKLAKRNDDLRDELVQEGMIRLWRLDVRKATKNPRSWVRGALRHAMIDYLRAARRAEHEPLDAMLATGTQLVEDLDTNTPQVVQPPRGRFLQHTDMDHPDYDWRTALLDREEE